MQLRAPCAWIEQLRRAVVIASLWSGDAALAASIPRGSHRLWLYATHQCDTKLTLFIHSAKDLADKYGHLTHMVLQTPDAWSFPPCMEVVNRAVTMTDVVAASCCDGFGNVLLGSGDGLIERCSTGEPGGYG